jgi:hypothetical protein
MYRHDRLNQVVMHEISLGARIESQSDFYVVLVKGNRPNHVLHLLLTVFTLGLWLPIWILVAITRQERRIVLTVDESGVVRQLTGVPAAQSYDVG